MSGGGNIKVVVRCRPLNSRELARGAKGLIRMKGNQTILDPPEQTGPASGRATEKKPMSFSFDKSYWSAGPRDEPKYASQQTLYEDLGVDLLNHSFEGFNTCIFACESRGISTDISPLDGADKGIIPLTTSELFRRVESRSGTDSILSYTVEVSYIEIYNEKVRDLLNPKNKGNLKVREHPSLGPYVEDLSRLVVENYNQMMTLMDEGNKARTVASTNMNETSSRSHAVFTVILTQKRHDPQTNMTGEKVSKISLVDLAGSERQASTGATGTRLKEGANINKSLTTLGKVIAALAQASADHGKGKKRKDDFVPYRDSVLTWLLKESLGGNSKTAMIAAISPADYEETLSTLRYADAAKKIKTHAVVNEDPNAKLIRELKEELELLRSRVSTGGGNDEATYDPQIPSEKQIVTYRTKEGEIKKVTKLELQDQLQASEKLMESLNLTWEEKMEKTQQIHVEREKALEELGISIDKDMVGVHAPQRHPSLVNLNEDPLMSECLIYQLKPGSTVAGSLDDNKAHIKLSGQHILPEHCIFTNEEGVVTVEAMPDARTFVNGKRVPPKAPIKLQNGFRVILGDFHVFRFNDPASVRAQRQKLQGSVSIDNLAGVVGGDRPETPNSRQDAELMDWTAARREVADIEKLGDQDLDRLFDDIVKVRTQRKRPESRYDISAELESRLMTASETQESLDPSSNPWLNGQMATTMTSNSIGTPVAQEVDTVTMDEGSEAGTEHALLPAFVKSSPAKPSEVILHQEHLTRQLKTMAQEVKRIKYQAAAARAMEQISDEPANWTARDLGLVQYAIKRWKCMKTFSMAEQILTGAVNVREANVIAAEMGKVVSYNFLIVDNHVGSPTSSLDDSNGIVEFEDVSETVTAGNTGSAVVVKVIDRESDAVYLWDLHKFQQQLNKMRRTLAVKENPSYSVHFRVDGIFTDTLSPSYSFIGSAKAPLRLLATQVSHTSTVPIMCQYTMEAIGSCRISFKCASPVSSGVATPESAWQPLEDRLVAGNKLSFTLTIDGVKGLSSVDYASIHAQTRLSSLVGSSIMSEDIFVSLPIDLDRTSVAHLNLRRNISVILTEEMIRHIRNSYATVELFAKLRPEYLRRLERWDKSREINPPNSTPGTPNKASEAKPAMRRCETDFVANEHHDILASIEIRELASNGDYVATELLDDIFQLHQGLQSRLHIRLTHSSGKAFPWKSIQHVSTSDVRLVDKNHNVSSVNMMKSHSEMRMNHQEVVDSSSGVSVLTAEGVWDTSSHGCKALDRRTSSDTYLLVKLTMLVEVETLDEPALLSLDLKIRILGRDSRRSSILTFFQSQKIYHSTSAIFSVDLVPPLARNTGDLWRLDTSKKHVRGEELLGDDWKPRSLSLLEDFRKMQRTARNLADVQATKVVLDLIEDVEPKEMNEDEKGRVMQRCLDLWKLELDQRVNIDVGKESPEEEAMSRKMRMLLPDLQPKLVPTVKLLPKVETVIKSGSLMVLRDPQNDQWVKMIFVLRRPYLHLHEHANAREIQIINLSKATVTPSPEVETLLGRNFAFTVFSSTNSYILQAASEKEMKDWISVISVTCDL
uniref:Kinesin n=1 Tax=Kwoniella dejecticola CBS 10117 TaxID=1296121 RepID=A0A1A5ZVS2_9TREE|nr:kinesin [Kwoniella dejecticola CBS 10117]OBR81900.1 kinesin [Kwoniella dejecticola CBS 10117]